MIGTLVLNRIQSETEYQLQESAWQALEDYHFPGNVRELQNILERACALCEDSMITADDLGLDIAQPSRVAVAVTPTSRRQGSIAALDDAQEDNPEFDSLDDYLQSIERRLIRRALEECRWNKTATAERLGISFRALRYKLKKLDIQ